MKSYSYVPNIRHSSKIASNLQKYGMSKKPSKCFENEGLILWAVLFSRVICYFLLFIIAPCLLSRMWEYTRLCCWVVCASFPGGKRSFTLTQQSAAFEYAIHKCFMKVHECYFLKGTACHGVYLPHSNIIRVLWSTRRVFLTHLWLSFLQDDRVIVGSLKSYAQVLKESHVHY